MERVDDSDDHGSFEPAPISAAYRPGSSSEAETVAARQWALPRLPTARLHVGRGPEKTADCKANEVSVPQVISMTEAVARPALLATAPLDAAVATCQRNPDAFPGSW